MRGPWIGCAPTAPRISRSARPAAAPAPAAAPTPAPRPAAAPTPAPRPAGKPGRDLAQALLRLAGHRDRAVAFVARQPRFVLRCEG